MRTWRYVRAVATMMVVAALLVQAAVAGAQEKDPATGEPPIDAKTAALVDARIVAEQQGWGMSETIEYLDGSRRFADLATVLADKYAEVYASAEYGERPGGAAVVRFAGPAPREALALIDGSRLAVKVLEDARYTEAQLQDRAKAVHEHLLASGYKQVAVATRPGDTILASVHGDGKPELPGDLREGVELAVSRGPVASDEHTRGGAPLLDGGVFECTSGFTVVNAFGTTGVATAGHCDGLDQYRQPEDGLTYGLTHQAQHNGVFGDYEWKTTPHVEPAEYFARPNEVRAVNSVSGQLPVNTTSCVFGRSSNLRACDQVFSNFVIASVNGTTNFNLIAMDNDNTIPGDSGGPWSFNTIADGIHKGDIFLSGAFRNMWSRADLLPLALGVSVRTQ